MPLELGGRGSLREANDRFPVPRIEIHSPERSRGGSLLAAQAPRALCISKITAIKAVHPATLYTSHRPTKAPPLLSTPGNHGNPGNPGNHGDHGYHSNPGNHSNSGNHSNYCAPPATSLFTPASALTRPSTISVASFAIPTQSPAPASPGYRSITGNHGNHGNQGNHHQATSTCSTPSYLFPPFTPLFDRKTRRLSWEVRSVALPAHLNESEESVFMPDSFSNIETPCVMLEERRSVKLRVVTVSRVTEVNLVIPCSYHE